VTGDANDIACHEPKDPLIFRVPHINSLLKVNSQTVEEIAIDTYMHNIVVCTVLDAHDCPPLVMVGILPDTAPLLSKVHITLNILKRKRPLIYHVRPVEVGGSGALRGKAIFQTFPQYILWKRIFFCQFEDWSKLSVHANPTSFSTFSLPPANDVAMMQQLFVVTSEKAHVKVRS